MRDVEELKNSQERLSKDHRIGVENDIKKVEEDIKEHEEILWFETIERILQGELLQGIAPKYHC